MKAMKRSTLATLINATLFSAVAGTSISALAAEQETTAKKNQLEVIQVTARKRVENAQEVPVAVSALQGDSLDAYSSAGMDIRFMNAKIPSLSIESSFGRSFPRFYVRGLGNTDFDLNASQPVSLVVDEIVQENAILKGFPVFDVARVEVLRGPQGTLFGRNTPAGLVKFDTVKPSQEFEGYGSVSYGSRGAVDFEGAVGGSLTDRLSTRVSVLWQDKDDYIDNRAPGFEQKDALGGYTEQAARIQFLYEGDDFTGLFNYHVRDLDGSPIAFRANTIKPGTNDLVDDFENDVVYHDAASRATQQVESQGASLKLEWDLANHTVTSISGWESAEIYSRADIDGGYGGFSINDVPVAMGPGFIPFSSESADGIPDQDQYTQELRLSSNFAGDVNYQVGVFYFDEALTIENFSYDTANNGVLNGFVSQQQDTKAWAVFGSVDYTITDDLKVTAGLRYSDDEKEFSANRTLSPVGGAATYIEKNVSDDHVSWDLSANYKVNDDVNWYGRIANSFRAPSLQGRILFGDEVTVADSETVTSFETGIKSDVLDGQGRVNATVFYYTMDDQQLTAVGGGANFNRLLNADKTTGYGFEIDSEWVLTDELNATFNLSYNKTELKDKDLAVAVCAQCTVTDPTFQVPGAFGPEDRAILDGNSLPHAPEWISNITLRYTKELAEGEFFTYADVSYRSEIDFFLYESVEFEGKPLTEVGLRAGYAWAQGDYEYEVSAFVRNLFDEQQAIGGVDFNNNTAMVNEERYIGAEFKVNFF
ncbi:MULTISPECIES: TonB-dependent receptor [Pseudoalteromonas]|jgi:iron complex outermembrane receptor protein|uniref:TonB-dependent receptor n=3 Tax=unclassified Pseudoalteromonas TaxID=194690 RepID=A0AB39ASL9_9GAMM|nr:MULTISPECIES: TonB-dependent receptor [Pseudoalteromonas]KGJ99399.1 TonB-dependent receptor [Pseudoalteromonas sp. ND6B]MDN3404410.1 TonB-dependent receptor [Pseudoalteromonas sp. APC 3218]MDN3408313.1 TonB-dependent receptor [Pseudoalteromonas sp. APC 3894]MDN3411849.1 TonB-dependent receptor [Pseudoalteromonas sp. APC 3250]MDN3415953.1 TonB-dependent receptor [Pseudoalteromonas sp. APC 3227]|tara:strand:- start:25465 stop:27753 length:2289 start_codon:yes stop_codon:yes gene_type:complete